MANEIRNEIDGIFKNSIDMIKIDTNIDNDHIPKGNKVNLLNCSVLFVDLRGSSLLSSKIGRNNMTKIYKAMTRIVVAASEKFNGKVKQVIGDGFLVIFTKDNKKSGQNAFDAAFKINNDMKDVLLPTMNSYGITENIDAGYGVRTGEAIFAKVGRRGKDKVQAAVFPGDITNYASKFCNIAKENEIIIDEDTYQHLNKEEKELFKQDKLFDFKVYKANLHNNGADNGK